MAEERNNSAAPTTQVDTIAEAVKDRFLQFLCGFQQDGVSTYSHQAEVMRNTETSSLFVDFSHIAEYDYDLGQAIQTQYYRWEPYLRKAIFEFIRVEDPHYIINDDANKTEKEFFVCFYNMSHVSRIRNLKAQTIGQLVSFSGTVTRTSEVRPELLFGGFSCCQCGVDVLRVEQQFKYCEPTNCPNIFCANNSDWELITEKSTFVDWQKVKIQENSNEIPPGCMPRSIDVILRHENVEQAKAGDRVVFTGSLIVVPDVTKFSKAGETVSLDKGNRRRNTDGMEGQGFTGLKSLGVRELTYKLCFLACSVQTSEQRFQTTSIRSEGEDHVSDFTEAEIERIHEMRDDPQRYTKMARSLCPSVYGHDEIRKGILLMLFGGVHKKTFEGIKLRGDINICIVGDPSTAKSQFLKYICSFLPRAIYTSGKASSAAGLTASVSRDPETGEYCVEAGALMLADNGICCIDEFDKMDPMDQVAIHEAMEQQTISITKAGIQATLNARTSVLAAANPQSGRYDRSKRLKQNVNISAPIMSRFDLFFVILDECDEASDYNIAQHIVNVHRLQEDVVEPDYKEEELQKYIKYARQYNPSITEVSKKVMIDCYRRLRSDDVSSNGQSNIAYRITVRQLESMIRLSEGLARLDLDNIVRPGHVREAYRLLQKSIIHVDTTEVSLKEDCPMPNIGDNDDDTTKAPQHSEDVDKDKINSENTSSTLVADSSSKSTTSLSFEAFASLEKALVRFIREEEEKEGTDECGIQQRDVVVWYLEQQDLQSEKQMVDERNFIHSVIERLVRDGSIQVLEASDNENMDDEEGEEDNIITKHEKRWLTVHPNYALD